MKKLLLIIPAYNEEKNIDRVMKELLLEYQIYDLLKANYAKNKV